MDLATLRELLSPHVIGLTHSYTHVTLPAACDRLGLPALPTEGVSWPEVSYDLAGQAASAASKRGAAMAVYMLMNFDADWDEWKPVFDSDPVGRRQIAIGHSISRSIDNPNDIFLRTEYNSVEDAQALRERLLASGVLDRFNVKIGPTIVEVAEQETY